MRRINQMFLASLVLLLVILSPTKASSGDANAEDSNGERMPELRCGKDCTCSFVNRLYYEDMPDEVYKEYEVICNSTTMKSVKITEAVFDEMNDDYVEHTYVRLEDIDQVTVTQGMVERWLQFGACSMDFSKVGKVLLPIVENITPSSSAPMDDLSTQFAGIGLFNSGLDSFPSGLFTGKPEAGLHLLRSSVGHMSLSEVFKNVSEVKYLMIHDSDIGVLEAGMNSDNFLQINGNAQVDVINSTLVTLRPGALKMQSSDYNTVFFDNVTFVHALTESIMLAGKMDLSMENSIVAKMEEKAMVALDDNYITIKDNVLILQPLALNHLPCSNKFEIENNFITVLSTEIYHSEHYEDINNTQNDPVRTILEMALDKSCVCSNLFQNTPSCQEKDQDIIINNNSTSNTQNDSVRAVLEMALNKSCNCSNLLQNSSSCQETDQDILINNNSTNLPQTSSIEDFLVAHLGLPVDYLLYASLGLKAVALLLVLILSCCLCRRRRNQRNRQTISLKSLEY